MIQVKRNQPTLLKEIQRISLEQVPLDNYSKYENGHGRESFWYVFVFDAKGSHKAEQWKNLRRVIHVHKMTVNTKTKKISHNDRYYISDLFQTNAQDYHTGIQGHWKIENSLHWVKDVVHGEDGNNFKANFAPVNVATFSTIAINIQRKNGNHSITEGQIKFGAKLNELFDLLRT